MPRILVTGCSGFLASYLIDLLKDKKGYEIHGLTEVVDFKSSQCRVYHLDLRDPDKTGRVIKSVKPEIVYHLAAVSNVGYSWKNQRLTYEVNFIGSSNTIENLWRHCPESRIILMSSAELYGGGGKKPIKENLPTVIRNPYALSKLAMEMVGDMYFNSLGMDIIKVRSFNFTGPGQDKNFVCSDFACQIAEIERGRRDPVIRVGNLAAVRDFSDVRDIAGYLIAIGEQGERGSLYHVCSGTGYSINSMLESLLSFSKVKIEVVVDRLKFRPVDTPFLVGDCSLIRKKLNCNPRFDLHQTLLDVLNYWRNQIK